MQLTFVCICIFYLRNQPPTLTNIIQNVTSQASYRIFNAKVNPPTYLLHIVKFRIINPWGSYVISRPVPQIFIVVQRARRRIWLPSFMQLHFSFQPSWKYKFSFSPCFFWSAYLEKETKIYFVHEPRNFSEYVHHCIRL